MRPVCNAWIPRQAFATARQRLASFPILTLTGPRQSGKTTLARQLAPELPYHSLEEPDTRAFAQEDPRGFLRQIADGAILDEVQRCPDLFSYLQGVVDADGRLGRFILTGSSQFDLIESITQSLAGRASLMTLLPFSLAELQAVNRAPTSVDELLFQGLFPPVHVRPVDPAIWLQDYVSTYVERDVRQMLKVQDLATFQRFVQLCAGRVGQLLNVSSLASDAGVTRVTADAWLSVLQTSHLLVLVRPWFSNEAKRLIKTPKLYFVDPGLAGWLMGIRQQGHLAAHPLRGALFENWVMTELWKAQAHAGHRAGLHFLRDKQGHEVDAWVETGPGSYQAVEIKAGETVVSDYFKGLDYWRVHLPKLEVHPWVVHGGLSRQQRTHGTVLPWTGLEPLLKCVAGEGWSLEA